MSTRTRLAASLSAVALTLTLAACADDGAGTTDGASGTQSSAGATSEEPAPATDVAEGEEISPAEFVALMKSPGLEKLSSYTMEMTMRSGSSPMTMSGAADLTGDQPALDLDMDIPGAGAMNVRMADGRVFIAMPGQTPEGKFMEVPAEQLGEAGGALEDVDLMSQMEVWEESAKKVVFVGEEDVDGTTMRRYSMTIDGSAAMDAAGVDDAAATSSGVPEEFVYDVWLDADNLMRKMAFETDGLVTEVLADNWGEPQDISVPADEDIVDIGSLGGTSTTDS